MKRQWKVQVSNGRCRSLGRPGGTGVCPTRLTAFAADRSNHSLGIWILPGRPWCNGGLFDLHPCHSTAKLFSINLISIPELVVRRRIFREGFNDLLRRPDSSWVCRDVEVNDLTPVMQQDEETVVECATDKLSIFFQSPALCNHYQMSSTI